MKNLIIVLTVFGSLASFAQDAMIEINDPRIKVSGARLMISTASSMTQVCKHFGYGEYHKHATTRDNVSQRSPFIHIQEDGSTTEVKEYKTLVKKIFCSGKLSERFTNYRAFNNSELVVSVDNFKEKYARRTQSGLNLESVLINS